LHDGSVVPISHSAFHRCGVFPLDVKSTSQVTSPDILDV